ncbi:Protein Y53G8AR.8, partial [Aphelenchoides avenae]
MNSASAALLQRCTHAARATSRRPYALWKVHQWKQFRRWQDLERDYKEEQDVQHKLKNWLKVGDELYLTPERGEADVVAPKNVEDMNRREQGMFPFDYYSSHTMGRYLDHSFDNIRRVREYSRFQVRQYDQRFIPERLLFLGADLAAAHFLVHRDAAVKFVGEDSWYKRDEKGRYSLPGRKIPGLHIEAIDASGTELMFEGFDNLYDLEHLRMLRLAGCPYINDWALSRVGGMFGNTLEMLDLSGCTRISAKGLYALRHLKKLQYLRLEGLDNIKDVSKTALLLEDAIPGLKVVGLDYDSALKNLEREMRLLEDERVVIDAK